VLRACANLVRPGGRTAFLTIHPATGLSPAEQERAVAAGPRGVAVDRDHETMLRDAGFTDTNAVDLTDEYRQTQAGWREQWDLHSARVIELVGRERYEERQEERRNTLAAIDAGLLRRSLFAATRA
jgi:hypothetical protein